MLVLAVGVWGCVGQGQTWEVTGHAVDRSAVARIKSLADRALSFLQGQFSINLPKLPRIEAFGTVGTFAEGLRTHDGGRSLSPRDADRLARQIAGRRIRDEVILINLSIPSMASEEELLGLITHELTHTFQYHLLAGRRAPPVPVWFMEGQALLMSALMRESYRPGGYAAFKAYYTHVLEHEVADGRQIPDLDKLPRSIDPHTVAMQNPAAGRGAAFLAVEILHQRYGQARLEKFLTLFQSGYNEEENFALTFGVSYVDFVREAKRSMYELVRR